MTSERVIEILTALQDPEAWESQITDDAYEALDKAIEAVKKDIKIKPKGIKRFGKDCICFKCPTCGFIYGVHVDRCGNCGQAIDWSEYTEVNNG